MYTNEAFLQLFLHYNKNLSHLQFTYINLINICRKKKTFQCRSRDSGKKRGDRGHMGPPFTLDYLKIPCFTKKIILKDCLGMFGDKFWNHFPLSLPFLIEWCILPLCSFGLTDLKKIYVSVLPCHKLWENSFVCSRLCYCPCHL